ncbi:MAG: hypothetical protein LBL13_10105 [Bacteroidales bacterium]|nr:hypothetical protein [Bacteroidales bacterium]
MGNRQQAASNRRASQDGRMGERTKGNTGNRQQAASNKEQGTSISLYLVPCPLFLHLSVNRKIKNSTFVSN